MPPSTVHAPRRKRIGTKSAAVEERSFISPKMISFHTIGSEGLSFLNSKLYHATANRVELSAEEAFAGRWRRPHTASQKYER